MSSTVLSIVFVLTYLTTLSTYRIPWIREEAYGFNPTAGKNHILRDAVVYGILSFGMFLLFYEIKSTVSSAVPSWVKLLLVTLFFLYSVVCCVGSFVYKPTTNPLGGVEVG